MNSTRNLNRFLSRASSIRNLGNTCADRHEFGELQSQCTTPSEEFKMIDDLEEDKSSSGRDLRTNWGTYCQLSFSDLNADLSILPVEHCEVTAPLAWEEEKLEKVESFKEEHTANNDPAKDDDCPLKPVCQDHEIQQNFPKPHEKLIRPLCRPGLMKWNSVSDLKTSRTHRTTRRSSMDRSASVRHMSVEDGPQTPGSFDFAGEEVTDTSIWKTSVIQEEEEKPRACRRSSLSNIISHQRNSHEHRNRRRSSLNMLSSNSNDSNPVPAPGQISMNHSALANSGNADNHNEVHGSPSRLKRLARAGSRRSLFSVRTLSSRSLASKGEFQQNPEFHSSWRSIMVDDERLEKDARRG